MGGGHILRRVLWGEPPSLAGRLTRESDVWGGSVTDVVGVWGLGVKAPGSGGKGISPISPASRAPHQKFWHMIVTRLRNIHN